MARFVCQPLFCDGLTPPIDFNDNSIRGEVLAD
jgi:hypothetical protein